MSGWPGANGSQKRSVPPGRKIIILGVLILCGSGIALALELKTLLTPGNFPIGTDPSLDIVIAAGSALLLILGVILIWRGLREIEGYPAGRFVEYLNLITVINLGLLLLLFTSGVLLFSANRAFTAQKVPSIQNEPAPGSSMQEFPTPVLLRPTPTYDAGAIYLGGAIMSPIDSFKIGDIWISASKTSGTINYIQIFTNPMQCSVMVGGAVTPYAINQSQQLIAGPIQIQDGDFFTSQDMAVIHGIMVTQDQAYGTVYLHYSDSANNRACDLGSFTWTAVQTGR